MTVSPSPEHPHIALKNQQLEVLEKLENRITELAAHINAATYQLLLMIGDYDEKEGWQQHGLISCAHWLQWKCGTNLGTAREKVRVAQALPLLPLISMAFEEGRVSYSKVRAMTRVATPENEDNLLNIALHGTAAHVETVVRDYRRHKINEFLEQENLRHTQRQLSWQLEADGNWTLKATFTPEQAAVIKKALNKSLDETFKDQQGLEDPEEADRMEWEPAVPAMEVPEGMKDYELPNPVATKRADALERIAESFLANSRADSSGGDRYLIHLHTQAEDLREDSKTATCNCEDHDDVSAETSRRMSCDASVVHWRETEEGESLSIGRKSRSIPPAIRRALRKRDLCCLFPGCNCKRFVDAHHITHWADGGETRLSNLVLLCRRHHRLVHEGGFGVHAEPSGEIWFSYPNKDKLPTNADGRFRGNAHRVKVENWHNGIDITERTLPPNWGGEIMDRDIALLGLICRESSYRP